MFRKVFLFLILIALYMYNVSAVNILDLEDPKRDPSIRAKHLERYIEAICKSRKNLLKDEIKEIEKGNEVTTLGTKDDITVAWILPTPNSDISLLRHHFSDDSSSEDVLRQKAKEFDTLWRTTFANKSKKIIDLFNNPGVDTLFLYPQTPGVPGGLVHKVDLSSPRDLCVFYDIIASKIEKVYGSLQNHAKRMASEENSYTRFFLEMVAGDDESYVLQDFISIFRVLRPHVNQINLKKNKRVSDVIQKYRNQANQTIEGLIKQEHENAAPKKNELARKDEIQKMVQSSNGQAIFLSNKKEMQPEQVSKGKTPKFEQKNTSNQQVAEKNIKNPPEEIMTPPPPPKPEEKLEDTPVLQNELKQEALPRKKEKRKTRPDEGQLFIQSLNGFFEEEPALEKATKKLKQSSEPSEIPSSSTPTESPSELHKRRLKVLDTLLNAENINSINVDESLTLLEFFGFIPKGATANHSKMKAEQIDLWVDGERTIIELPPVVTMSATHKSGGERVFKHYIVQRIRDALRKAGFDKLLKE